ncbi:hypothetical protein ABT235_12360 [Micromonospora echinofusca]|uniref:hypothetical protein n=1 Tax=Micromonospora echinofusca TaxID=47858 RepID=UPI0033314DE0
MFSMKITPPAAGALGAAMLAAVAGCATHPAAPSRPDTAAQPSAAAPSVAPPVEPPRDSKANYTDPAHVCQAFVTALYRVDTTRDAGPDDAFARASAHATGALAGQSAAADRDGRWETWAAHRVRVDVHVRPQPDMHPQHDSTIEAHRAVRLTATPVGDGGWRGWTEHSVVSCTLRAGDSGQPGWRVAHYEVQAVRP